MEPILSVQNLRVSFRTGRGFVKAVDGLTFEVKKEEGFGLVGESGCGKSTTGLAIMGMLGNSARIEGGRILFSNEDLLGAGRWKMRQFWGRKLFMIFQDPVTSLNPIMKIRNQLKEAYATKEMRSLRKKEIIARGCELLRQVEISDPERVLDQFPHQLSGGMKQRVMIALSMVLHPDVLILDEPTTALDATVQFRVVELLHSLKLKSKMSQLLITHNFSVAAKLCDRIAVMYAGKIVEVGQYRTLLKEPVHPYTQGLFKCIIRHDAIDYLETMPGSLPSLSDLPKGCYFEKRCGMSGATCREFEPALTDLGGGHLVACHFRQ